MALLRIFPFNPNIKGALLYSHMKSPKTFLYILISKNRIQGVQIIAKNHLEGFSKDTVNSYYGKIHECIGKPMTAYSPNCYNV